MYSGLCNQTSMAVDVPGLVAVMGFYIVILVIGIWASRKSKKEEKACTGNKSEVTIVGGRNINVLVGVFTMTGKTFFFLHVFCYYFLCVLLHHSSNSSKLFVIVFQLHGLVEVILWELLRLFIPLLKVLFGLSGLLHILPIMF